MCCIWQCLVRCVWECTLCSVIKCGTYMVCASACTGISSSAARHHCFCVHCLVCIVERAKGCSILACYQPGNIVARIGWGGGTAEGICISILPVVAFCSPLRSCGSTSEALQYCFVNKQLLACMPVCVQTYCITRSFRVK